MFDYYLKNRLYQYIYLSHDFCPTLIDIENKRFFYINHNPFFVLILDFRPHVVVWLWVATPTRKIEKTTHHTCDFVGF